jgi:plasmid segregation protein ParM
MGNAMVTAVDIGYRWLKGVSALRTVREPSIVGAKKFVYEDSIRSTDIIFNEEYFIGNFAVRHSDVKYYSIKDQKYDMWTTEILLKTALGLLCERSDTYLVTGLPMDFYETQKESLETMIEKVNGDPDYTIRFGRGPVIKCGPIVLRTKTVPQPLGSAMDYLLDDNGDVIDKKTAKGSILVIDPGSYTLGLLALHGMEVGKESCSPPGLATDMAYKLLQDYLREHFGRAPSKADMDPYVLKGEYEGTDISPLIEKAFQTLSYQIQLEIEGLNTKYDTYIVTGGNADIIGKYLNLPNKILLPDAQMANVRGYRKIARRLWKI